MRTYLGKFVNNGEAPVFVASVKEDGFDVTEELLRVAAADEAKYYSAPEVNDELAAMDAEAVTLPLLDGMPVAADADDKPKYIPSPTFAQKMLRGTR